MTLRKEIEEVKNFLYRLHFPCKREKCNCDKVIKQAMDYLYDNVGGWVNETNTDTI